MSMQRERANQQFTFERGLRELAERIIETDHIAPLQPGETRPPGYYMVHHYWSWGRKPLPPRKSGAKN